MSGGEWPVSLEDPRREESGDSSEHDNARL
jgi:hypothetical protein